MPPLNAVRAFVAAARHLSFTLAAAELNVTHGAVSRQVKSLEGYLGVALFERGIRRISLTPAGEQFAADAGPALAQVAEAAERLMANLPNGAIRINVRPSFAVRWLIPRLSDFVSQYPGIEPQVITSTAAPDLSGPAFDIAIRRGPESWPGGLQLRSFLKDEAFVVGAPGVLAGIADPRQLSSQVLLLSKTRKTDWDDWKKHAGFARLKPASQLVFDHLHFVLQAAVDGLGFTIAPASLLSTDLETQRLISPLSCLRLPLAPYYYGLGANATREAWVFARWLAGHGAE
jgi:LysR family glycine cleavage system transcriptional activator